MAAQDAQENWFSSWPDLVAFVAVLAIAWWARWSAGDLVWSLWLSSLVVGYSTILWMIGQPAVELARASLRDRGLVSQLNPKGLMWFWVALVAGVLFLLAFFTVHFGMFHYIHSQFLISFFPIEPADPNGHSASAGMSTYMEIARRYWPALPSAFLAHRAAFRKPLSLVGAPSMISIVGNKKFGNIMTEPYRNVIRMHMLIFFFAAAHFAKLENFAVYAVVYAVYFFPWRLLRRPAAAAASVTTAA